MLFTGQLQVVYIVSDAFDWLECFLLWLITLAVTTLSYHTAILLVTLGVMIDSGRGGGGVVLKW